MTAYTQTNRERVMNAKTSGKLIRSEQRTRRNVANGGVGQSLSGQVHAPSIIKVPREEALRIVDELRQRNNQELLMILEEEQKNEAEREAKLREVAEENERKRLEKIFGIERARASERIVNTSTEHEVQLRTEMRRLGLA